MQIGSSILGNNNNLYLSQNKAIWYARRCGTRYQMLCASITLSRVTQNFHCAALQVQTPLPRTYGHLGDS